MNIKKCDRCGKVENPEPIKITNLKNFAQQLNDKIQNICMQIIIGTPPAYKLSLNEKEFDLCERCQEELREWFEAKEGTFEKIYKGNQEEAET